MNQKKQLKEFIGHIVKNDFSKANDALQNVVNEKTKQRIAATYKDLNNKSK
jgi:hypothetical protein